MRRIIPLLVLFLTFATGALAQQDQFYRLVTPDGKALHVESGPLELGAAQPGWWSAMWERGDAGHRQFVLRNRHTGQYLVFANGNGQTGYAVTSAQPSPTGSGAHYWKSRYENGQSQLLPHNQATNEPNVVPVVSELYIQDVVPEAPVEVAPEVIYHRLIKGTDPLNVEQGSPVFSPAGDGFESAMWEARETRTGEGRSLMFTNRWTGQVLSSSGATLITQAAGDIRTGTEPFVWRAVRTGKNLEYLDLSNSQGARLEQVRLVPLNQPAAVSPPPQLAPNIVYYRILSGKNVLNVEHGPPVLSAAEDGFHSAMWEAQEIRGSQGVFMVFTNRWTGQVLSSSGATLTTQALGNINTLSEPFLWRAVKTGKTLEYLDLSNSQGARLPQIRLQQVE